MRRILFILLLAVPAAALPSIVGCRPAAELELSQKFQAAQKAFDQARSPDDFLKAAALYQEIRDRRGLCGAVLYNQGNAFMRAGSPGRAIAAYRQAKRYRPNDRFLEANLDYALAAQPQTPQRRPLIEHLLFWQNWISYPGKFHLAAAATAATFLLGVLALFIRRRLFARLAIAGVVVTLLLACSAAYDWYRFDYVVHGVVAHNDVVARKGYATSYEPAFTEPLAEGTEFRVLQRRGDWLLIRLPGNQQGWIDDDAAVVY